MKNNNAQGNGVIGNAAQSDAIRHHKGPAMVIAGPGSGKTFVIVQRLLYLIEEMHEDPSRILVITFTKAAAIEMQQRFYKLTDSSYPEVNFGTFHSVFYQIIRQSKSGKQNLSIADEGFKFRLIRDILNEPVIRETLKKNGCDTKEISDVDIKDIITDISRIKNTGEDINSVKVSNLCKAAFKDIFGLYNRRLREFGKIDFDDMICRCLEILQSDSELLSLYQNKFTFFLVDEYQDINSMQFKILKLLSKPEGNVFVVGDDDQSIYGFRGSDPGIMLTFEDSFKEYGPRKIILKHNYRCGKKIIENACLVINENKKRYNKDIIPGENNSEGYVITRRFKDKASQYKAIAAYLGGGNVDPSRVAIIYRTNQEALLLAACLKENGITTNLDAVSKFFAEDEAVSIVMSYISFACLGHKRSDFLRIMNKPMRFISREAALEETINEKRILDFYKGNPSKKKDVKKLFIQINMISHLRPYLAVRYIRRDIGIEKLYPGSKEALDKLQERARSYDYADDFYRDLKNELEAERSEKNVSKGKTNGKCVKLLTMHGSKGLEFDIVWLPDLNEGIIPSRSAETSEQIEEERRMLYVGMTRAKTALIMSYIAGDEDNPMLPSRFLRPIRHLWENKENNHSSPSRPSSGSSTISSNSTSSR